MNKTNSIFLLGNYRKTLKELLDKSGSLPADDGGSARQRGYDIYPNW